MSNKIADALRATIRECSWAKREKWCACIGCRCQLAYGAIPLAEAVPDVVEALRAMIAPNNPALFQTLSGLIGAASRALAAHDKAEKDCT